MVKHMTFDPYHDSFGRRRKTEKRTTIINDKLQTKFIGIIEI